MDIKLREANKAMGSMRIPIVVYIFCLMWIVYFLDFLIPGSLTSWGIQPRSLSGLLGIVFAPILHHGMWHILSNSIPLLVLGILLHVGHKQDQLKIIIGICFIGGIGTWSFGSTAIHVGASGLIMGLWSLLITSAIVNRSPLSILTGIVAFVVYAGFLFTVIDVRAHISWSSHVFGLIAGFLIAKMLDKRQ
ncbi:MAG: rhomboid family intramembrane serine protease [Kangiella sp.]|nr:MAG: rhomboid family intramembrane serine protease [Kangiella sp.]